MFSAFQHQEYFWHKNHFSATKPPDDAFSNPLNKSANALTLHRNTPFFRDKTLNDEDSSSVGENFLPFSEKPLAPY